MTDAEAALPPPAASRPDYGHLLHPPYPNYPASQPPAQAEEELTMSGMFADETETVEEPPAGVAVRLAAPEPKP